MSIHSDRLHTSFSKHPFPTSTNELESEIPLGVHHKLNEEPYLQNSIQNKTNSNNPSPHSLKSRNNHSNKVKRPRTSAPSTIYIDMSSINSSAAQLNSEDNLEESQKINSESRNPLQISLNEKYNSGCIKSNPYSQPE